jgi:S1-C subfamily serine protease
MSFKYITPGSRILLVFSVLLMATLACALTSGDEEPTTPPATLPPVIPPTAEPDTPPELTPDSGDGGLGDDNEALASATVQIYALYEAGDQWDIVWTGSGSILTPDGLILTNAHVVDKRYDEYTDLGVGITGRTDEPPQLLYLANIAAIDYGLDLAVIRVVTDMNGSSIVPSLPFITLGDSDVIGIGADLRILGYPGIGGDTITFTEGAVSGFNQERGVDGRAWIKTDATIVGGNSGGMAVNRDGELIGVPTRASSGDDDSAIVDCRPVVDTNRDGSIDEFDTCVPIGGFINGLRPVNLAVPLIDAAMANREYAGGMDPSTTPTGSFDLSDTDFSFLEFADGVTDDDEPTQLWYALPSGVERICAFWDYEGMQDGMVWSAFWTVDGELDEGGSIFDNVWQGGEQGNWWVCIFSDFGLDDGTYELLLEVEGESLVNDAVFVGGERLLADFYLVNESNFTLCYVNLSPSSAQNWGQDELGPTEVIDPGVERIITVATGYYDLLLRDCEGDSLLEEFELEILEDLEYTVTN